MANIGGYGDATTAGKYRLVFNSNTIGTWLDSYESKWKRITAVNVRHNFWSTTPILDGKYPALVWTHTFSVYHEDSSLLDWMNDYLAVADLVAGEASALTIMDGDTANILINFGNCYIQASSLLEPNNLLLHKAGLFQVVFIGKTKPITT